MSSGQYIITLLSAFVSMYLPFPDVATKVACSMAISQILLIIGEKLFSGTLVNINIMKYFFTDNYVIIKHDNPFYDKFIELLYKKYMSQLSGCQLYTEFGKYKMMIEELNSKQLYDTYAFDNKEYKIRVKLGDIEASAGSNEKNKNSTAKITFRNIIVSSNAPMNVLEEYIQDLIKKCHEKTANNLIIYKPNVSVGKNRYITWKQNTFKTNKTIKNTIVSDQVNTCFFKDLESFINSEEYYISKGLAYKRGYLLHGEPGCGKTSVIKAAANEHNLPIFTIDMSIFETNNELIKIVNDINGLVSNKQRHMLIFEDIDRSKIFSRFYQDRKISEDCLLNILDGLDEGYGRITVMTTNNLEIIKTIASLIRPGRIDVMVHVTLCTIKQINEIMELYYNKQFLNVLNENIKITPAKLIQAVSLLKDESKVIDVLNTIKDFSNFDIEKYVATVAITTNNETDNDEDKIKDVSKGKNELNMDDFIERKVAVKKVGDPWNENLKKRMNTLNKKQKDIETMESNLPANTEKSKLTLEKKKINLKLYEIEVDKYKKYCEELDKRKKEDEEKRKEVKV